MYIKEKRKAYTSNEEKGHHARINSHFHHPPENYSQAKDNDFSSLPLP